MSDTALRLADLPDVLTRSELARVLRTSESTIKRREKAGVFPIPQLRKIDNKPRYANSAVQRHIDASVRSASRARSRILNRAELS